MQTETYTIWREGSGVMKPKQDSVCGEAGNALSKLCASQATKKCIGGSGLGYCCAPSQTCPGL